MKNMVVDTPTMTATSANQVKVVRRSCSCCGVTVYRIRAPNAPMLATQYKLNVVLVSVEDLEEFYSGLKLASFV